MRLFRRKASCLPALLLVSALWTLPSTPQTDAHASYDGRFREAVQDFADVMIEQGLDRYGKEHSPMFAADLSLDKLTLPSERPPQPPGVVDYEYQRYSWGGSNLYWDILTLRSFYLLSQSTDVSRYADAADVYLDYFVRYAPSPYTGLFPWGQHAYWRMTVEEGELAELGERWRWFGHPYHEFESFTPPWDLLWPKAPGAVLNFAQGIRDWHIWDYDTHVFDRHALLYNRDEPGCAVSQAQKYPDRHPQSWQRHAGLYIYTFAFAHQRTGAGKYLDWALGLSDLYWTARDPESNLSWSCMSTDPETGEAVPEVRQTRRGVLNEQAYWKLKAYQLVPGELVGQTLRDRALAYMRAWAAQSPDEGAELWTGDRPQHRLEGQAFSLAYKVSREPEFRDWLRSWADAAYAARPHAQERGEWNLTPERYGKMLVALLQLQQITGEARYLEQASTVADEALELLRHESGLLHAVNGVVRAAGILEQDPYPYYNSHTGSQTLLFTLMQLDQVLRDPGAVLRHDY